VSNDVEVRFGGNTRDLDNASRRAKNDIKDVGQSTGGLKQSLSGLKSAFTNAFSHGSMIERSKGSVEGMSGAMGGLEKAATGVAEALGPVGIAIAAVVAVSVVAVHQILEFGAHMAEAMEKLHQSAQTLGMSATELSRWNSVAMMSGMQADNMKSLFVRLERSMVLAANGGKKQSAAYQALGIDIKNLKSPTEALFAVADKFKNMDDGPKKIAIAMQLMGRAGATAIPILNQGNDKLKEMMNLSDQMGATVSDDMLKAGLAVKDSFNTMHLGMQGLKNILFTALAPAIKYTVDWLNKLIRAMVESYQKGGAMKKIVDALVIAFKVMATVVIAVGSAFVAAFSVAYNAIAMVYNIIKGLALALYHLSRGEFAEAGVAMFDGIAGAADHAKAAVTGVVDAIKGGFHAAAGVWAGGIPEANASTGEDTGMDLDMPGGGGKKKKKKDNSKAEAEKRMQAYLEEMEYKKELAEDDYDTQIKLQDEMLQRVKEFYGANSKEYISYLRDKQRMERKHARDEDMITKEMIDNQTANMAEALAMHREVQQTELEDERARLEESVELGKMSETEKQKNLKRLLVKEYDMELKFEEDTYQLHKQAFEDELALQNLRPEERRRILDELTRLEAQHFNKLQVLGAKQRANERKADAAIMQAKVAHWKSIVEPITSAMNNIFQSMLQGTTSFKSAVLQALTGLVSAFAQKGFEMLTNWIAVEIAKTASSSAGAAARGAVEVAATTTSIANSAAAGIAQVTNNAAVAASGAAAATAAIPVVGPALSPGVAAAILAMVLGFGAMIASARGGFDIPSGANPLTQLHEEEMVLPKHIANPLRRALAGAGPRGGGLAGISATAGDRARSGDALRGGGRGFGDINIHAMDARSFARFLRGNRSPLAKAIQSAIRDNVGTS
jgi:hypothetical protein